MLKKSFIWQLFFGLTVMILGVLPVAIIFLLNGFTLTCSDQHYVDSICQTYKCQCHDWTRLSDGNYIVENNVWNKGNMNTYQQCVYLLDKGNAVNAGWGWDWPGFRFQVFPATSPPGPPGSLPRLEEALQREVPQQEALQ